MQASLFPDPQEVVVYEQPLNERVRGFLRLEHLFDSFREHYRADSPWGTRVAMHALIEITDLLSRWDVRAELLKELERQLTVLRGVLGDPRADEATTRATIEGVERCRDALRGLSGTPGQTARADELVSSIRQRVAIPGGTCNFDLPAFHFWLTQPAPQRSARLAQWAADLQPVDEAVRLALGLVRGSCRPVRQQAERGFYQQPLDPGQPAQMLRVQLPAGAPCFPEISAGKHRFSIRFLRQGDTTRRPVQVEDTVAFELQCCRL